MQILLDARANVNAEGGAYGNALQAVSLLHLRWVLISEPELACKVDVSASRMTATKNAQVGHRKQSGRSKATWFCARFTVLGARSVHPGSRESLELKRHCV